MRISPFLIRSFFFSSFSFLLLFPLSFISLVYFPFLVLPSFLRLFSFFFSYIRPLVYALLFTQFSTIFFVIPLFLENFFLPSFLRLFSRIFRLRNFLDFFLYSSLLLFFVFSPFYFLRPLLRLSFTLSYIRSSSSSIVYALYIYSSSIFLCFFPSFLRSPSC